MLENPVTETGEKGIRPAPRQNGLHVVAGPGGQDEPRSKNPWTAETAGGMMGQNGKFGKAGLSDVRRQEF